MDTTLDFSFFHNKLHQKGQYAHKQAVTNSPNTVTRQADTHASKLNKEKPPTS